jgi:hypothetical protein
MNRIITKDGKEATATVVPTPTGWRIGLTRDDGKTELVDSFFHSRQEAEDIITEWCQARDIQKLTAN